MTEVTAPAENATTAEAEAESMSFGGSQRNMVVASAFLLASLAAFTMNMTGTYFAAAIAWTFAIWGALLLFSNLLDLYQTYEVRDDGLYIHNQIRFWSLNKLWDWDEVNRVDVLVDRQDTQIEDVMMHVYRTAPGEIVKEREDRTFNARLAQLIIERANLQPVDDANPQDLNKLPLSRKATYHWTKTGAIS